MVHGRLGKAADLDRTRARDASIHGTLANPNGFDSFGDSTTFCVR